MRSLLYVLCAGSQVSNIDTFLKTDKRFSYKIKWVYIHRLSQEATSNL